MQVFGLYFQQLLILNKMSKTQNIPIDETPKEGTNVPFVAVVIGLMVLMMAAMTYALMKL